jgi:hypothetical protein
MNPQPRLSDADWTLIIELLECERGELPAEIHHCRVNRVREQLRQRLERVRTLLERLQPATTVSA